MPAPVFHHDHVSGSDDQDNVAEVRLGPAPLSPIEGIPNGLDRGQGHHAHQGKSQNAKQAGTLAFPIHPLSGGGQHDVMGEGRVGWDSDGAFVVPGTKVVRRQQNDGHYSVQCDQEKSDQTQLFPELEPGVKKLREASVLRAVVDL